MEWRRCTPASTSSLSIDVLVFVYSLTAGRKRSYCDDESVSGSVKKPARTVYTGIGGQF